MIDQRSWQTMDGNLRLAFDRPPGLISFDCFSKHHVADLAQEIGLRSHG
jgi:hypothetical protein